MRHTTVPSSWKRTFAPVKVPYIACVNNHRVSNNLTLNIMSTRANIIIREGLKLEDEKVTLYYHSDGYPEWLGVVLQEVCKQLSKCKWFYCSEDIANMLVKRGVVVDDKEDGERVDDDFSISAGLHGDIEFIYVIDSYKDSSFGHMYAVKCWAVTCKDCKPDLDNIELVEIPEASPYFNKAELAWFRDKKPTI